jgi:hypothetical protein
MQQLIDAVGMAFHHLLHMLHLLSACPPCWLAAATHGSVHHLQPM